MAGGATEQGTKTGEGEAAEVAEIALDPSLPAATHWGLRSGLRWRLLFIVAVLGLILGVLLIPVATRVIVPLWGAVTGRKAAAH